MSLRECLFACLIALGPTGLPAAAVAQGDRPSMDEEAAPLEEESLEELDEGFEDFLPDQAGTAEVSDPLEGINRPIFNVNIALDRFLMRPVTRIYMEVPEPARNGISNALQNLKTPVILANDLLQGEMGRAGATFGRFFINTVVGLFGLIDVAEAMGLPGHDEDFGQTLAVYGVPPGPYLVLPVLGPSNLRDTAGFGVDTVADPLLWLAPTNVRLARAGTNAADTRAATIDETETLEKTALDFYASVRSLYNQNREFEIRNGRPPRSADNGR